MGQVVDPLRQELHMNPSDRRAPIRQLVIILGIAGAAFLTARAFFIRRASKLPLPSQPLPAAPPFTLPAPEAAPVAAAPALPRALWLRLLITQRVALALIAIAILGTGMGFLFSGTANVPQIWGDGFDYWNMALAVREGICLDAGYCPPRGALPFDLYTLLRDAVYNRGGVMPVFFGILFTVLPTEQATVFICHFLMAGIVSALLAHLMIRLKFPLWVGVLAGVLNALYIPFIINAMTVFQQPFIRFTLILSLWAYGIAFTSASRFARWGMIGVGTGATFLLAFSSFSTRPLMWVIPCSILLICAVSPSRRRFILPQIIFVGIQVLILMTIYAYTLSYNPRAEPEAVNGQLLLGVSPDSANTFLTTVRSFEDFWAPSEWGIMTIPSRSQSLWSDFAEAPFDFVRWFNFSLFSNWRYPDHTFIHGFILSVAGQHSQHTLLLVLGSVGFAFWSGMRGTKRLMLISILIIGGFVSVIYAVISVEPRRFSVLMPLVIAGASVAVYAFRLQPPQYRWRTLGLLLAAIGAWSLPLGVVTMIVPLGALGALIILTFVRVGISLVGIEQLLHSWQRDSVHQGRFFPRLVLSITLILLVIAQFQDQEWRMWNAPVDTPVRQEVHNLHPVDGFVPWLVIDNDSASLLRETQITINGQILKPAGTPMLIWEAGPAGKWYPYVDIQLISGFPPRRMWYGYPIPEALARAETLTITLDPMEVPITLRGDYANGDPSVFDGPSLEPWMSGHSFWRWQWNGDDPRIPKLQSLNGHYTSSVLQGGQWLTGDLSPEIGKQDGAYRIFVIWSPLGWETNALLGAGSRFYGAAVCPNGWAMRVGVAACRTVQGDVDFYTEGGLVGTAPASVFTPMTTANKRLYQINGALGRVDVIQVMNYTYLANYYLPSGEFYYSLVFEKPPS